MTFIGWAIGAVVLGWLADRYVEKFPSAREIQIGRRLRATKYEIKNVSEKVQKLQQSKIRSPV